MVRPAARKDIETIMSLSQDYHKTSGFKLPWTEETMQLQIRNILIMKTATAFVNEENDKVNGIVGGPIVPWPYDIQTNVAQEYMAFGQNLGELRRAFYLWALNNGADAVIKLCVDESPGPRTILLKETM